jgi:hypothetical protein
LLLEGTAPEEVGKGSVEVPQRFLWSTFGDLIHPGDLGLLEDIELPVQFDSVRAPLGRPIPFLLDP